ncbi:cytochrome c/c1 heme-lyase [Ochromonadaceae sp. CCMP2298]|nr:cytochrome c/c1 heme-lyase [Ochromonadaceae sp. CCMP2298]
MEEGCPVDHKAKEGAGQSDGCPVDHKSAPSASASYNAPANDMAFGQDRYPGQQNDLSVRRKVSTIPKGSFSPAHQPSADIDKWVYPSEQQYFNAMKRKGYSPAEVDIPVVLFIHNNVNEQGWSKVKEWESYSGNPAPKLVRFIGRPKDMSPKAILLNWMGYTKPFDRHDWVVDRHGKEVRYVIDFYGGASTHVGKNKPVSIYLDVRPAVDSAGALVARLSFAFRQRFQPFRYALWTVRTVYCTYSVLYCTH